MDEYHLVPLSKQPIAILRELQLTGNGKYLFPSLRTNERPISEATLNAALRGWDPAVMSRRLMAFEPSLTRFLNELGFPPDVTELQLAHTERNKVRAAYNRAQRLEEPHKMMQAV